MLLENKTTLNIKVFEKQTNMFFLFPFWFSLSKGSDIIYPLFVHLWRLAGTFLMTCPNNNKKCLFIWLDNSLATGTTIRHLIISHDESIFLINSKSGVMRARPRVWAWGCRVCCSLPVRAPSSERSWGVKAGGQMALYKLGVSSSARNLHVRVLE